MPESRVDAAASVLPARSSTSWAKMCRADRLTASRGRSAVPLTFLRTRRCRRARKDVRTVVCPRPLVLVADMSYFPAFPTLRRMCSPEYRRPLPLYGSGLRSLRMLRSEEHTSELQSLRHLVCRRLLEK